jgi:micrococcal nuclease
LLPSLRASEALALALALAHPPKQTVAKATKRQHLRFDSKNAKPVANNKILQGAAYIIDGDSLVIKKTQVRLFGIDAPELDHPYGKKAKWALLSLCKGQVIRAEVSATDTHGRTVAKCYLPDGRDLSAEMVKAGLAIDWPKFSGGVYSAQELPGIRKKLWLADARQKGQMHVWTRFEVQQKAKSANLSKKSS